MGQIDEKLKLLNKEQLRLWYALKESQQNYILYRANGLGLEEAYQKCGYTGKGAKQSALKFEKMHPEYKEIIDIFKGSKVSGELAITSEVAKQIAFYKQVIDGEICTVKRTIFTDNNGNEKGCKIEEYCSVQDRIYAIRELNKILNLCGMGKPVAVEGKKDNKVNIMIVDATKQDEIVETDKSIEEIEREDE